MAALFLMLCTTAATAQVATLDGEKVLGSLPVLKRLDTMVSNEQGKYLKEYQTMQILYNQTYAKADSLYKTRPNESQTKEEIAKVQKLSEDMKAYENSVNAKMADYRALLFNPYYDKINSAVKAVAQRLKYKQVIDIQKVSFVYIDKTSDITDEVIRQLKQ